MTSFYECTGKIEIRSVDELLDDKGSGEEIMGIVIKKRKTLTNMDNTTRRIRKPDKTQH